MSDGPGQSSISQLDSAVRMIPALRFLHKRQANLGPEEEEISATTEAGGAVGAEAGLRRGSGYDNIARQAPTWRAGCRRRSSGLASVAQAERGTASRSLPPAYPMAVVTEPDRTLWPPP